MPLGGGAFAGQQAGEVEAFLGGLASGLCGYCLATDDDQAAGEGEVEGLGLAGEGVEAAVFEAAVAFGGLGKKGVPGSASSWLAWSSKEGWLPLICRQYSPPCSTMARAVARWQCRASAVTVFPSRAGRLPQQ